MLFRLALAPEILMQFSFLTIAQNSKFTPKLCPESIILRNCFISDGFWQCKWKENMQMVKLWNEGWSRSIMVTRKIILIQFTLFCLNKLHKILLNFHIKKDQIEFCFTCNWHFRSLKNFIKNVNLIETKCRQIRFKFLWCIFQFFKRKIN